MSATGRPPIALVATMVAAAFVAAVVVGGNNRASYATAAIISTGVLVGEFVRAWVERRRRRRFEPS